MSSITLTVKFRNGTMGSLIIENPKWLPLDVTDDITTEHTPVVLRHIDFVTEHGHSEFSGLLPLSTMFWHRQGL